MKIINTTSLVGAFALCVASVGCVIDDTGRSRGQSNAPSATVPDSGSPVRRESASDTLNKTEPASPPADVDVKVEKQ
jgi:hypothetical protein